MSQSAPAATVAALNEKIQATKALRTCIDCSETVELFWGGKRCRKCFIETQDFVTQQEYAGNRQEL